MVIFCDTLTHAHVLVLVAALARDDNVSWVPSPGVDAFIGFAAYVKLVLRFESARASALHTLPFGFNSGGRKA